MARLNRTRRDRLGWSDVTILGEVDGWRFLEFADEEYLVHSTPMDSGAVARPVAADEIRIGEPYTSFVEGTPMSGTRYFRDERVASRAYEQARAKWERRTGRTKRGLTDQLIDAMGSPVDLLAGVGRKLPRVIPGASRRFEAVVEAAAADARGDAVELPVPSSASIGAFLEGRRAARGPDGLLRWMQSKGSVKLIRSGRLLWRAKGGSLRRDEIETGRRAERLVAAHLRGEPLTCETGPHGEAQPPLAVTIIALDVAACEACTR